MMNIMNLLTKEYHDDDCVGDYNYVYDLGKNHEEDDDGDKIQVMIKC